MGVGFFVGFPAPVPGPGPSPVQPFPLRSGMDTLQFLRTVLPSKGIAFLSYNAGRWPQNKTDRNSSLEYLSRRAVNLSDRGFETWQAMSSFNPDGDLNEWGNLARSAANAMLVRSAWQDWDVDPEDPKKFPSLKAAAAGALEFYSRSLPAGVIPLIVRSGGGLHTYIVFDRDVPAVEWVEVASMAKAVGVHWGAKFDRTRAADLASLMRPVGTKNHKKGAPRPVSAINAGEFTLANWESYSAKIRELFLAENIPLEMPKTLAVGPSLGNVPAHVSQASASSSVLTPDNFAPSSFARVLARCSQMAWADANQPAVTEPLWRAVLSVAGRCTDGQHAIHWISRKHAGYDAGATQAKFDGTPAPFRCAEFEMHNPGGCDGCVYKGTIKSPITLGEEVVVSGPIKRDVRAVQHVTEAALAEVAPEDAPTFLLKATDIPALNVGGFKYSNDRIVHTAKIRMKDKDGKEVTKEIDEVILDHPFYPVNIYVDTRDETAPVWSSEWYAKPPGAPEKFVTLTAVELAGKDPMLKWLGRTIGFTPPHENQAIRLISAMKHWLKEIRAEATREIPATLGWFRTGPDAENKETVFVLGNKMLTENGIVTIHTANHLGNAGAFEPTGDLAKWLEVYKLYNRPGFEKHAIATLVGFAAPLVEMSPLSSMVVNLTGKSGGGKSTLQAFVSTIYGTPTALVKGPDGTAMSQTKFVRDMQNLPVMFDDFHKLQPAELVQRTFVWANGWNSEGLTRSGQVNKDRGGKWRTAIMASTNADLHDAIKNYFQGDKRAARMRVMQISIPEVEWGEEQSSLSNITMAENHGQAGLIWLDYVRRNRNKITRHISEMQVWIEKNWGAKSAERFFTQGCALLMVALYHAKKVGVCPLDLDRMVEAVHQLFLASKRGANDVTNSPDSILADYINARLKDTITTVAGLPDSTTDRLLSGDERHLVVGRFVKNDTDDPGELLLLLDPLREWCTLRRISCNQLQKDLFEGGFTTAIETTVNLGWKLPAFNSPRAKGIRVKMEKLL